jgi:hypothetical protein
MIRAYSVDDITIIRGGRDQWGEPLPPTNIPVKGYIDWKTKLVRDIKGEEVVAAATVYLLYDGLLNHEDRFLIAGLEHPVINIFEGKDFSRNHYEVYIA